MSSYIIEGGRRLEGEVEVSGSKNASLPILAATILNKGNTKLYNVPNIHDTKITQEILKYLGFGLIDQYFLVFVFENFDHYQINEILVYFASFFLLIILLQ